MRFWPVVLSDMVPPVRYSCSGIDLVESVIRHRVFWQRRGGCVGPWRLAVSILGVGAPFAWRAQEAHGLRFERQVGMSALSQSGDSVPDDAESLRGSRLSDSGTDDDAGDLPGKAMEPRDYWEAQDAMQRLARFDGHDVDQAQATMPMLVAVRMRPMWQKEADAGDFNTVRIVDGKVVIVIDPWYDPDLNKNREREKRYAFDMVFDENVGQDEVYQKTAHGLVSGILDGYNASVFAYGATGAGKTHTMLGSLDQPGVMVNTLHDMFMRMQTDEMFRDKKFKETLSYSRRLVP